MKNIFFGFTVAVLIFSAQIFSQNVPPQRDFQVWNDISIAFPLIKSKNRQGKEFDRLTFLLNGTLRFGRSVSRPVDERIGFGFSYRLNKYVSLVPDYFYRAYQAFQSVNQLEHRVRFAVILSNKWKSFSLNHRQQIEHRFRHFQKNSTRLKSRLRFEYPFKRNEKEIFVPFASGETFYDFSVNKLTRGELLVGVARKFNKRLTVDFFYLFAKDRNFPKTINGIGTALKFNLSVVK